MHPDVFSRSLNLETPSALTTLIANLSETNNELRNEIFDIRRDVADARDSVANGKGTLTEAQRQLVRLRVFSAESAVSGPGISIKVDGSFDERALSGADLTAPRILADLFAENLRRFSDGRPLVNVVDPELQY